MAMRKVKLCDSAAIGAEMTDFAIKEWQYRSQDAKIYAIDFMHSLVVLVMGI